MNYRTHLLAAGLILTGCSGEHAPTSEQNSENPRPAISTDTLSNDAWAAEMIRQAAKWEPVTPEPVYADRAVYTLCRAPDPTPPKNGPHYGTVQGGFDSAFGDPNSDPKVPANQFIVNTQARPYFYQLPDKQGAINATEPFKVGSTIVKEKYDDFEDAKARQRIVAIAVMTKREPGYDPEHGDWEYGYINLNGQGSITSVARGKLANCIDCHGNRSKTDYIFRNYELLTKTD